MYEKKKLTLNACKPIVADLQFVYNQCDIKGMSTELQYLDYRLNCEPRQ